MMDSTEGTGGTVKAVIKMLEKKSSTATTNNGKKAKRTTTTTTTSQQTFEDIGDGCEPPSSIPPVNHFASSLTFDAIGNIVEEKKDDDDDDVQQQHRLEVKGTAEPDAEAATSPKNSTHTIRMAYPAKRTTSTGNVEVAIESDNESASNNTNNNEEQEVPDKKNSSSSFMLAPALQFSSPKDIKNEISNFQTNETSLNDTNKANEIKQEPTMQTTNNSSFLLTSLFRLPVPEQEQQGKSSKEDSLSGTNSKMEDLEQGQASSKADNENNNGAVNHFFSGFSRTKGVSSSSASSSLSSTSEEGSQKSKKKEIPNSIKKKTKQNDPQQQGQLKEPQDDQDIHSNTSGSQNGSTVVHHNGNEEEKQLSFVQRHKRSILLLALLVAVVAAVMSYFAVQNNIEETQAPTISPAPTVSAMPTPMPSQSPTNLPSMSPSVSPTDSPQPSSMPSSSPTRDFRSILEGFLGEQGYGADLSSQPGSMALDWILDEAHDSDVEFVALQTKTLQRFAVVTLEFSLLSNGNDSNAEISSTRQKNNQNHNMMVATKFVDECNWEGVTCNNGGQVTKIEWPFRKLKGHIPPEIRFLFRLEYLDISNNDLRGSIPETLYSLASLERLYLFKNSITGTISSRISLLDKITHLHLSHNNFSGSLPDELKSDWDGIRPLRYFNVYFNKLTGELPKNLNWRECTYFDVGRNQLTGTLPESLGEQLVELRHLHLDHNRFTGTLPLSYNNVGNGRLESLTINHNRLTGVVSGQRDLYNKMSVYTLQENQFTSMGSEICNMLIPWGEMPELKADCDICNCTDFFNICARYCDAL